MEEIKPSDPELVPVPDVVTHTVPGLEPIRKPFKITSLVLPILLLGVFIAGGIYAWTILAPSKPPKEQVVLQPTPSPVLMADPSKTKGSSWVYIKDENVFLFSQSQGRQQPLTSDGIQPKTWHLRPKFVNKDKVSYVRCQRVDEDGTDRDPYTCSLTLHDLSTNQTTNVFTLSSVQNSANYAIGGYITAYDWKPTADEFVALTDEADEDGLNTKLKLHHYTVATGTDTIVFEHPPTPGRGGSLDDQVSVRYSPDYTKVVLIATGMLPSFTGKPSTLMVFDTKSVQKDPIWSSDPGKWATFGTWLTPDKLAAKTGSSSGSGYSLISIDPANPKPNILESDPEDWYAITAISPDTVVYYTFKKTPQSGVSLVSHNIESGDSTLLESNLFPVKYLGDNMLAVRTTRNCASDPDGGCGMDMYNGVQQSGFGVFDIETKYTQSIPIPKGNAEIYDFDVIAL